MPSDQDDDAAVDAELRQALDDTWDAIEGIAAAIDQRPESGPRRLGWPRPPLHDDRGPDC